MWTHGRVNELHITGHGPRCLLESESCYVHAAVDAVRLRSTRYDVPRYFTVIPEPWREQLFQLLTEDM